MNMELDLNQDEFGQEDLPMDGNFEAEN